MLRFVVSVECFFYIHYQPILTSPANKTPEKYKIIKTNNDRFRKIQVFQNYWN